jgi:ubiquinone biosynthesis protein UbiJ
MNQSPVTKSDVQKIVQKEIQSSEKRLTEKISLSEKQLDEKLDSMIKEFQNTKEEMTLQMGKYEQINDIEDRVDILEQKVKKLTHPVL